MIVLVFSNVSLRSLRRSCIYVSRKLFRESRAYRQILSTRHFFYFRLLKNVATLSRTDGREIINRSRERQKTSVISAERVPRSSLCLSDNEIFVFFVRKFPFSSSLVDPTGKFRVAKVLFPSFAECNDRSNSNSFVYLS